LARKKLVKRERERFGLEREDTRVRTQICGESVLLLGSRCFERVVAFLKKM
jgi:hypothetical protein